MVPYLHWYPLRAHPLEGMVMEHSWMYCKIDLEPQDEEAFDADECITTTEDE